MIDKITKGKVIAGAVGIAIAGYFWSIFFPPGGSGANILLGVFVALFFVYYFAGYFGRLIDQEFFPGGSKTRARLFNELEKFIKESQSLLSETKKSKRKRKKIGQKALDSFDQAIIQAVLVRNQVKENWANNDQQQMNKHELMLKEAHQKIEQASQSVFSLSRNWRFLYGMPSLIAALFLALMLREFFIEPYQIPSGSMIPTLLVGDHLFVSKFHYGLSKPFTSDPDFLIQWRQPKVGDVVIFKAPDYVGSHAGQAWIKRVVATGGQKIQIKNHVVHVDDKPYDQIKEKEIVKYLDYYGFGASTGGVWREQRAVHTIEKTGDIEHQIHLALFPPTINLGPFWPHAKQKTLPGLSCEKDFCVVGKDYLFVMGDNRGNSKDSRSWGALHKSRIKGKAMFIWMSVDGSEQSVKFGPFNLPRFRFDRWFTGIK